MIKSNTKTAMKKVVASVEAGNKEEARMALINAVSAIDKASSKGVYHKNNAARKKSRLSKIVNTVGV